MATFAAAPATAGVHLSARKDWTNEAAASGLLLLLFVLGAFAMLPVTVELCRLWHNDPLRSFGALLPVVSIALTVRAWRSLGWPRRGTAWGLLPIAVAVVLARTFGTVLIAYRVHDMQISPVQPGLLYFLFGSGVVLLLGGTRLWRASLLPLCLLLCVNPVPHLFERIDFPLQVISANTARNFARVLGLQPTGEQLQMLFAPHFGMVIVPGCNGVRGSATMVYLALLIGYLRRMPRHRIALLMLAGLATGYLLNLTRLCLLVIYYWVGVHFPHLRGDGELIDYCIGGSLFALVCFAAGMLLFRPQPAQPKLPMLPSRLNWTPVLRSPGMLMAATLLFVAAVSEVPSAWAVATDPSDFVSPFAASDALPRNLGPWQATSQWTENYYGRPVWLWTHYRRPDGAAVDFGMWLSPKRHFAIQSRLMNGSKPLIGDAFQATAKSQGPLVFSTFTLQDDLVDTPQPIPTFFAEATCLPHQCGVQEKGFQSTGWIFARTPVSVRMEPHMPILYRVQSTPGTREDAATQAKATAWITDLARNTDMQSLVEKLGTR